MGLRPTDVVDRFGRIARAADEIRGVLAELMDAGVPVNDRERTKAEHLQWLLTYVLIAQDGGPPLEEYRQRPDPESFVVEADRAGLELIARAGRLSAAASAASAEAKSELLRTEPAGRDPGLATFVDRLARVWVSLSGRGASVNKVSSRADHRPDFVKFVQAIGDVQIRWSAAGSANPIAPRAAFSLEAPTDHEIASAFRRTRNGVGK
jgi:hypothetical protein